MAAQEGTTTGLAAGLGLGEEPGVALGVSVGLGVDDSLASADGEGLWWAVPPLEFEQPATAKIATMAATLIPTGNWNGPWRADVTAGGFEVTASTITALVFGLNERWVYGMRAALGVAVLLLSACFDTPAALTADVTASATQAAAVGGRAQLVVNVTNTGPAITHIGLTFISADRWYEHHTVTDSGNCSVDADHTAFDCGDLAAGASATYSITGTATQAGTFHYQLALRELVRPFKYVNDHSDGADVQTWDETITPS
jgi:hypothetical protein